MTDVRSLAQPPFGAGGAPGLAPGALFEERFVLERRLGEGGMGQVWLAQQTAPVRRRVAIKLIRAGMYDESTAQRFRTEPQSLAMMDHPYIAKVFEAGATLQGQPYFVMEYVPGLPITSYCDQRQLGVRRRLELFIRACEGVQHAHQKAILHRDLKPANVLILEVDGEPVPRLIDFGLARPTGRPMADPTRSLRFGQLFGTPGYISPEQVDADAPDVDTRSDVYALGVILCELLTGQQPFEDARRPREPPDVWLRRLREQEPPKPSAKLAADPAHARSAAAERGTSSKLLQAQLRGDLDAIVLTALERNRERRYASPRDLAEDLRRFLRHDVVSARAAGPVGRLYKFIRRNRVVAAVGVLVLILAVLASGVGVVAIRRGQDAERQARATLLAQSRLVTEAAAQLLRDEDVARARALILEVFTSPDFVPGRTAWARGVLNSVRAADAQLAVLAGHRGWVYSGAFSPDGRRLLTASTDGTLRIWDGLSGAPLRVLSGQGGGMYGATYAPDGLHIVTASQDGIARIWDARSGQLLRLLGTRGERLYTAQYGPDGTQIVTASADHTARIWDARTGESLRVLAGHGDYVRSAAFSPDGRRIVTASFDKSAGIWDARTGRLLLRLSGHTERLYSAVFSPDGREVLTASADGTARIWDARSGQLEHVLPATAGPVYMAAYAPDGLHVVTGGADASARVWDVRSGALEQVLAGHQDAVFGVAFSPDGGRILTVSDDGTGRLWQTGPRDQIARLDARAGWGFAAVYSPDARHIAAAFDDHTVRIWDRQSGVLETVLSGHTGSIYALAYAPDGVRLITAANDKTARLWDTRRGTELRVLSGHTERVTGAAIAPDGQQAATSSADGTVRIWDLESGALLRVLTGHNGALRSLQYAPRGERVVATADDGTATIWNAHTGARLLVIAERGGVINAAAFSPDGARLATGGNDGSVRLYDATIGQELARYAGHAGAVWSVAFSAPGTQLLTASTDRTVRLWDIHSGAPLLELRGHRAQVNSAVFAPDAAEVLSASDDGSVRRWRLHPAADLETEVLWEAAAQIDPLTDAARDRYGLARESHRRVWPQPFAPCDEAAAAYYDPDRAAPGIAIADITASRATSACAAAVAVPGHVSRADYQLGRARRAQGDVAGARAELELAITHGVRAASVDLADLLLDSGGEQARSRAIELYQRASRQGVGEAAVRLAQLYERSGSGATADTPGTFDSQAWEWYQRAAEAGQPEALARLAEREEAQAAESETPAQRDPVLLDAFAHYAAAVAHAMDEGWPEALWRNWRYRRASLARALERDGEMDAVAERYRPWADFAGCRTGPAGKERAHPDAFCPKD